MSDSADELAILIEEVADFGIITVKANVSDEKICSLLERVLNLKIPKIGKVTIGKKISVGWMSPDEIAVLVNYNDADKLSKKITEKMKSYHHLIVNMSDSRQCFKLTGKGWRDVLSKGTPIDLNPDVFGVGSFRRTRIASVAVSIWATDTHEAFLFSQRSVGGFISDWLRNSNRKTEQVNYY